MRLLVSGEGSVIGDRDKWNALVEILRFDDTKL